MSGSAAWRRTKALLKSTPLGTLARWGRFGARFALSSGFRATELLWWREYRSWRTECRDLLRPSLVAVKGGRAPIALIVGKGTANGAKIELFLIKGFELAGYAPVVLTERTLTKFYRLAGVNDFIYWDDFCDEADGSRAAGLIRPGVTLHELLDIEHGGVQVGRFAVSTALRTMRAGHLDMDDPATRRVVSRHLSEGMMRAAAAARILRAVKPAAALLLGNRYTGQSELMDLSVAAGVSVITWFEAHRSSALMLKRYTPDNLGAHHASLSEKTWRILQAMPWTAGHRRKLAAEIRGNYETGDWYSRGGTQFGKRIVTATEVRQRLGLDPAKKTVAVFPHILWDATLFWGKDLFDHYEQWLVETARAACANDRVNWIFKIHPANAVKIAWEGILEEPAEVRVLRAHIGTLPPHVVLIPAESDINTFSLFDVMDGCVTVRGTIGIEAASFGINVLTAGTGRYDGRGFTIDSPTPGSYLEKLAHIESLPPLTPGQRERAERFAYGAFVLRPWSLETLRVEYERDDKATMKVRLAASQPEDLRSAPDLRAFAGWVATSDDEDFLDRHPVWAD